MESDTTWTNSEDNPRFWEATTCDGLFLLFDCSAHVNDGTPDVSGDEFGQHLMECPECRSRNTYARQVRRGVLTLVNFG